MEYLTGYTIKPHTVTGLGEVRFTDGTNTDMGANQVTCEAYGYTYDITSGTCRSFRYNTNLNRNINSINNKNNGSNNTNELGSNTIQINGSNNRTRGFNNNCFINGSSNEIANGVDDATVLGSYGKASMDGEVVIGGGDGGGQSSNFSLNGSTTDATPTDLAINGAGVRIIPRDADTVHAYSIDVIACRTGGTSGSGAAGDRIFLKLQGIVKNNVATESLTTIAAFGTTAWVAYSFYNGNDMTIRVEGTAAMNINWVAKATFHLIQT